MKQLLFTIVILLSLAYQIYDIKYSIKTGEASLPTWTIIKKQHPRLFKFAIMIKMFAFCICLLVSVKLGFDLLRMLW